MLLQSLSFGVAAALEKFEQFNAFFRQSRRQGKDRASGTAGKRRMQHACRSGQNLEMFRRLCGNFHNALNRARAVLDADDVRVLS